MWAQVAVPLPLWEPLTYAVDAAVTGPLRPGTRVWVPVGARTVVGWVVGEAEEPPPGAVKEVLAVLDDEPLLPPALLDLARWMAAYYVAPLGLVLRAAVPGLLHDAGAVWVRRVGPAAADPPGTRQRAVLAALEAAGGALPLGVLRRRERVDSSTLRRLRARGLVTLETRPPRPAAERTVRRLRLVRPLDRLTEREALFRRAPRQRALYETLEALGGEADAEHLERRLRFGRSVLEGLVARGLAAWDHRPAARDPYAALPVPPPHRFEPTPDQAAALAILTEAARQPQPGAALLHGVTGSGKTFVYIELLRRVVEEQGRTAIVLVPEIALTPQTVGRFRSVFGDRVAVLHSGLADGERYDAWCAVRRGEKRIVVGARSAIFAPLPNLGAIILDEEHEASYKNHETPRYHAREVALVRGRREGALVVLGSATPSLESWVRAQAGKHRLVVLPTRVEGRALPPVRVVDVRRRPDVPRGDGPRTFSLLSPELEAALAERLARGEQALLLLNRRGYASFVQCPNCERVWHCAHCHVSLTYHRRRQRLVCHYCFFETDVPSRCPDCGQERLRIRGIGTEQVERVVAERFPAARIARMDLDTTGAKWAHHAILDRVAAGQVDVLVGTQMIAKGLDFPNITLVGVISADVGLHFPDFRAAERTFQLLTQVAGRAGRGPKGGEVIVQTALPDHYAIRTALRHDYAAFVAEESRARQQPRYPPFCHLANVLVTGREEGAVAELAERAVAWVQGLVARHRVDGLQALGPAPCPIDRLRDRWRWHFLLRAERPGPLGAVARVLVRHFPVPRNRAELRLTVDRDPVALL